MAQDWQNSASIPDKVGEGLDRLCSQLRDSLAAGPRKIIIVPNWFEELKERVPVE